MSPVWGGVAGALLAAGLLLIAGRLRAWRRPPVADRVLPYLRDLPRVAGAVDASTGSAGGAVALLGTLGPVVGGVFGPSVQGLAQRLERLLGGAASVRRRLERAGLDRSVADFRVEQVLWGLAGFGLAAAWSLLTGAGDAGAWVSTLVLCAGAAVAGVLARDAYLGSQVTARERRMLAEFPTLAELLALAVAAGEGPVAALERVVARSRGDLAVELGRVLAEIRTGVPVAAAFDGLAARTGLPLVARFAQGVAVAVERGTPLADVLHAQAADVREAGRRLLIESAARKEVAMMVPVVFLILPVTVVFAFWPGVVGLHLTTP